MRLASFMEAIALFSTRPVWGAEQNLPRRSTQPGGREKAGVAMESGLRGEGKAGL